MKPSFQDADWRNKPGPQKGTKDTRQEYEIDGREECEIDVLEKTSIARVFVPSVLLCG